MQCLLDQTDRPQQDNQCQVFIKYCKALSSLSNPDQGPHDIDLTAEDVIRRIAAECGYIDERGGVGINFEPAAAIPGQTNGK
jgi:hypothetical protein